MTYEESLDYIATLKSRGSRPGLERIEKLMQLLGNPQKELTCIHVTGTNGKGSVCAMLSGILKNSGYRVGMFTTPCLEKLNEMFVFDGCEISDSTFAEVCSTVKPKCEEAGATEYEFYTAVAFCLFKKLGADIVIIECCMGGLLDATNIIEKPLLSIITGIARDHTAYLGNSLCDIARHKAGIIKEGRPAVVVCEDKEALETISDIAASRNAPCIKITENPKITNADLYKITFDCSLLKNVTVSLVGLYQKTNALTAIYASYELKKQGLKINESNIRYGLANVKWKGRFEILCKEPTIIYDGCHNVQGCSMASDTLSGIFGGKKLIFVTGVLKDKEYKEMTRLIAPHADIAFISEPPNPRALPASELAKIYTECGVSCRVFKKPGEAVREALIYAQKSGSPVFVFGSLYMYGEIKSHIKKFMLKFGE